VGLFSVDGAWGYLE